MAFLPFKRQFFCFQAVRYAEGQKLCGSCADTLTFLDNQNKWRSVDFNKSYDFPVDKGNSIKE